MAGMYLDRVVMAMAWFSHDKRFLQLPTVRSCQINDIVMNGAMIGMNIHDPEIRVLKLLVAIAGCGADHATYGTKATEE